MPTITTMRTIESTLRTTTALALGGAQITTGHQGGLAATIEGAGDNGTLTLHVTQLTGETDWIIDAAYIGGCPAYANGEGARYCKVRAIADEALIAQLDEAAAAL